MKKTVNFADFENAFESTGRTNHFSAKGLKSLFDYLEQLEEETGQELELDVIALFCDFAEYENIEDYNSDYCTEYESMEDIEETIYIPINDQSFIIRDY